MKISSQVNELLSRTKVVWVTLIVGIAICNNVFAQSKCPRINDRFTVNKLDVSNLNSGQLLILGTPKAVVTDVEELAITLISTVNAPFEINLNINGGTTQATTMTSISQAHAAGWQQLSYQSYLVDNKGNGCRSLILISQVANGPGFLVTFDPVSGAPNVVQSLSSISSLFSSGNIQLTAGRFNGDAQDDLRVKSNGVTLAVLTSQLDGSYAIDPALSASEVWAEFVYAVSGMDLNLASSYFSQQFSAVLAPSLQANLNDMAITLAEIVASEVKVKSPQIVEIQLVVKTGAVFSAYTVVITSNAGVWKIDAF